MNWSGGKDSAYTLLKVFESEQYLPQVLLTTLSATHNRISMHGVRESLLDKQAIEIGIPLIKIHVPESTDTGAYESKMSETLLDLKKDNFQYSIFGDIFLEDLRKYREENLKKIGMHAVFPLWKIPSSQLIYHILDAGIQTVVTCVNEEYLDKSFAGRIIDRSFIHDLPPHVDPCGENGEFHSFVFDAPYFKNPISYRLGEISQQKYTHNNDEYSFAFIDLLDSEN